MNPSADLECLISAQHVDEAVARIAREIARDFSGKAPILLGVLSGAFVFVADLIRRLDGEFKVDFVGVSSYGDRTVSSGQTTVTVRPQLELRGQDVLIVDDVLDTGLTAAFLERFVADQGARSVAVCVLLAKDKPRSHTVDIAYKGFDVPDRFVIGYGLDYRGKYRGLEGIFALPAKES